MMLLLPLPRTQCQKLSPRGILVSEKFIAKKASSNLPFQVVSIFIDAYMHRSVFINIIRINPKSERDICHVHHTFVCAAAHESNLCRCDVVCMFANWFMFKPCFSSSHSHHENIYVSCIRQAHHIIFCPLTETSLSLSLSLPSLHANCVHVTILYP